MGKRDITLEWRVAESDADWEQLQTAQPKVESTCLQRFPWPLMLLLLVLASMGGYSWYSTQVVLRQIGTELKAAQQAQTVSARSQPIAAPTKEQTMGAWQNHFLRQPQTLHSAVQVCNFAALPPDFQSSRTSYGQQTVLFAVQSTRR